MSKTGDGVGVVRWAAAVASFADAELIEDTEGVGVGVSDTAEPVASELAEVDAPNTGVPLIKSPTKLPEIPALFSGKLVEEAEADAS